jgi:hypothetical protein
MVAGLAALLLSGVALLQVQAQAIAAPDLVGTWTSKSNGTVTGDVRIHHLHHEREAPELTVLSGLLRPRRRAPH